MKMIITHPPTQQPWSTSCSWIVAGSPVFHVRACPPSGYCSEETLDNNSEKGKSDIFQAALQQQLALQCFPSQQGKVRNQACLPIARHIQRSLFSNFPFLPDDEQHGDPPLLSLLTASEPHSGPIQLTTFLLHLILASALNPRHQQQHPGLKNHLRSFPQKSQISTCTSQNCPH